MIHPIRLSNLTGQLSFSSTLFLTPLESYIIFTSTLKGARQSRQQLNLSRPVEVDLTGARRKPAAIGLDLLFLLLLLLVLAASCD